MDSFLLSMDPLEQLNSLDIQTTCRTCLDNLTSVQHNVFHTVDLRKKLHVCTSIVVEHGDGYPTSICSSCFTKLNDFYEFQQMCILAMKQCYALLEGDKKHNKLKVKEDKPALKLLNKTKTEPVEDPFENQEYGEIKPETLINVEEVLVSKKEESDDDLSYEFQDEASEVNNTNHDPVGRQSNSKQTRKRRSKKGDSSKTSLLVCEICDKRFHKEMLLSAHKRTHEGLKAFPCNQCDKSFSKHCRLKSHIKVVHEQLSEERLLCPEKGCGRTYALKDTLRSHIKEMHANKKPERLSYICEDCGKVLTSLSTLRNHRYLHTDEERPHECTLCNKRYITSHKLKEHLNRHAGVRNYVCPHCGARKTTRTELNTHINYHTKEKTYPCKFCDLIFNSIGNFGRHVRTVHEGIKNYKCKYCEKSFGKAETRKHHEMTHTGEKPHECKICHKKFIQSVSLHKHMKIHTKASETLARAFAIDQSSSGSTR